MSHPSSFPSWFVIKLTALASLGGCLFGYDMGAIAGALPQLTQQYALASNQQGWVVSILYLGGGVGALIGGTICDRMGRLTTILITDVLFILGAGWFFWVADSFVGLLIGRFLVGIAIAISGIADVTYLQEIAPQAWRGAIVSVNEACISLGFLYAYLAGYVYSDAEVEDWRKIFGLAGLLALVQGIGMWSMPESPVWLAGQGRIEQSEKVYQILRSSARSRGESIKDDDDYGGDSLTKSSNPRAILQTVAGTPSLSSYQVSGSRNNGHDFRSYESLESFIGGDTASKSFRYYSVRATIARYYRQAWIALFLAVTQQFCGQAVVLNYAPAILGASPNWSTLAMGGLKFLVTVIVVSKIEAIGRRFLLLCGMGLIAFGLLALSMSTSSLVLPGVLAVVCGYSMSFGPLTWLLTAEFFPSEIRGRALGISTIVTYTSAAVVTRTFLPMSEWLGYSFVFGGYAGITIVGMIFAYSAIPETGDRSLEQIEAALDDTRFWGCGKKMNEESTTTSFELSASQPSSLERSPQRSSRFIV